MHSFILHWTLETPRRILGAWMIDSSFKDDGSATMSWRKFARS
jgi:hypothetical protein